MNGRGDHGTPEPDEADDGQLKRWENASEVPLVVIALAFLIAYAWPILEPAVSDGSIGHICRSVEIVAWVAFVTDYIVRIGLSRHRLAFVRQHLLDLLVVVVPILRPLRLLRLVVVLNLLNRRAETSLRGRVMIYGFGSATLLTFVAALAVLDAERNAPGGNIRNFGDALWWALSTVTTAGYGDRYPITTTGRFVAGGLMVASIALLAIVTASLASWLLEHVDQIEEESSAATRRDIAQLTREISQLRRAVESRDDPRSPS